MREGKGTGRVSVWSRSVMKQSLMQQGFCRDTTAITILRLGPDPHSRLWVLHQELQTSHNFEGINLMAVKAKETTRRDQKGQSFRSVSSSCPPLYTQIKAHKPQ